MLSLQVAFAESEPLSGSKLEYRIFNRKGTSKVVNGNRAVEQHLIKLLLTDPGTDLFNPTLGAGLNKAIRTPVTEHNLQTVKADIGQAIIRAQGQMVSSQAGLTIPASERLLSVDIRRLEFDDSNRVWKIELKMNMEDGNVLRVLLGN